MKVTSVKLEQFCGNDVHMLNAKGMKKRFPNIALRRKVSRFYKTLAKVVCENCQRDRK